MCIVAIAFAKCHLDRLDSPSGRVGVATLNNTTCRPHTTIPPPEHKLRQVSYLRPSASLNLTRKGRIDGPVGGTMNAHNTIPRYLHPAHDSFPMDGHNNPPPGYQIHHAQPQPSNTYPNGYTPPINWQYSDQTVHASHQPATYVDNNHTQGTSREQGKFLLASSDNLEDVPLNDAMKPRGYA